MGNNELKTIDSLNLDVITLRILKQEAIKWLKSNHSLLNDCHGAVDDWIKHFFNITEDER